MLASPPDPNEKLVDTVVGLVLPSFWLVVGTMSISEASKKVEVEEEGMIRAVVFADVGLRMVWRLSRRSVSPVMIWRSLTSYCKSMSSFFLSSRRKRLLLRSTWRFVFSRSRSFKASGMTTTCWLLSCLLLLGRCHWHSCR